MSSKPPLMIEGTLDISRCSDVHRQIISSFDESSPADPSHLDLSKLETIDTAGVQLLISLIMSENKNSTTVKLDGLNDELQHNINMLGLENFLHLDE